MTEIRVSRTIPGSLFIDYVNDDIDVCKTIPEDEAEALREFFQAERDKALGWWRASPEYVVKPSTGDDGLESRSVTVLNERLGITTTVWEGVDRRSAYGTAARAYFAAHPEQKPWHDAAPGEVWVLTMEGEERPAIVTEDGNFEAPLPLFLVNTQSVRITAGRRIYPAQNGDNDE